MKHAVDEFVATLEDTVPQAKAMQKIEGASVELGWKKGLDKQRRGQLEPQVYTLVSERLHA